VTGKIKPAKIPDSGFVRKENRVQKKMQRIFFIIPCQHSLRWNNPEVASLSISLNSDREGPLPTIAKKLYHFK